MTVHECHCGFDEIDHTVTLDETVQDAIKGQVAEAVEWATAAYRNTYSVLTIHFAEGSVPAAVSIPYQPFHNQTDLHLPILVVKAGVE